ncbi:MAG: PAS domain S-box protein [Desulfobacteraceae bacterium]|nr:PAS domain S-box protein [Desulfobacteraceae bacterium]
MAPTYEELILRIKELEKLSQRTKEAFQITRTARRNYKRFLQFLPYPVMVRDPAGLVTYLNPAFTDTFGWTLKELKGKKGDQYVPKSLSDELKNRIKLLPIKKDTLQFYTKRLTKDGKVLDVLLRVGIERSKSSNPGGMIIVIRDVTMEKRFNRNRETMTRISQMLPQYPDLRKLLFFINTEIKNLLETESANTILLDEAQKEFYFLSAAHDDPATRERIDSTRFSVDELLSGQVVKTGKPLIINDLSEKQGQYESRDRKIGYKVKNVLLVPLRTKDRIIGILAADNKKTGDFDDTDLETMNTISSTVALSIENARVTRELRKAYEEVKGLNSAKDKMISHLSHELKTPVAILLSSFKILSKKMSELPEETWKPTMDRIRRNLDRIIGIENEVYDIVEDKEVLHHQLFSLILEQCRDEFESLIAEETGEQGVVAKIGQKIDEIFNTPDLVFENIFLSQFVEKRIEAIKPQIIRRDIHLITRMKSASPIRIPSEPLRKTVDGLIRNAIENTPDGGKIEVLVHQKGKGMQFIVKDHGIGLTEEARKRIFEGFFSTRDIMNYSSKRPYDFHAGGKGADLLRMKIFSERFNFKISMTSTRCQRIPDNEDACPGSIEDCRKRPGPGCNGTTVVTCFFPFPETG